MSHHQEAHRFHPQIAGEPKVLDTNIGFGAVSSYPYYRSPEITSSPDVIHRADPGQEQDSNLGCFGHYCRGLDEHAFVDP